MDPRSLRNCYLTEAPKEIALAVTQAVRKLGIVVQAESQIAAAPDRRFDQPLHGHHISAD